MVTNLPGLPHKLASSRVTNTIAGQNVNQVLFRVRESVDLLCNRVCDLFKGKLGSSRSPMEERENDTLLFLDGLNEWEREERHWEGRGKV